MKIAILFGTESGNAELVATDLADALGDEHETEVVDLADVDVQSLQRDVLYLVVCSTHGEGELPQSAQPFAAAVRASKPDLRGVRYAVFGLGDSTYPNYSRGSERVDALLAEHGAVRVGAYGRHDASGREEPSELAVAWATALLQGAVLASTAA